MSDVDANGNVVNTFLPSFSTRGNKNTTDIRRVVSKSPTVVKVAIHAVANGGIGGHQGANAATWQTVADLTGIDTCDEGVEILVHHSVNTNNFNVKPAVRIKAVGGATGAYSPENLNESFLASAIGSSPTLDSGEKTQSIFIPTTDLRRIQITNVPFNAAIQLFAMLGEALASHLEFRIT